MNSNQIKTLWLYASVIILITSVILLIIQLSSSPSAFSEEYKLTGKSVYENQVRPMLNKTGYPTSKYFYRAYQADQPKPWLPLEDFKQFRTPGIIERTRYPYKKPSKSDLESAWSLYNQSFEIAQRQDWFNFSKGKREGYTFEWTNNHFIPVNDTERLNKSRKNLLNPMTPWALLYYPSQSSKEKRQLVAMMWLKPASVKSSDKMQPAGNLLKWHYHPVEWYKIPNFEVPLIKNVVARDNQINSTKKWFKYTPRWNKSLAAFKQNINRTALMTHVWFVRRPGGPFSGSESLNPRKIKKPSKMSKKEFMRYTNRTAHQNLKKLLKRKTQFNYSQHQQFCEKTGCDNDSLQTITK